MDHIVPMMPRHDCGVGTIVLTVVVSCEAEAAVVGIVVSGEEGGGIDDDAVVVVVVVVPVDKRDRVPFMTAGDGLLPCRAGQVYVAIWARRRTVSSGKRSAISRPADRKPKKFHDEGFVDGSRER